MVNLTLKDLMNSKVRLSIVIIGLSISMMLILFGVGMFNGTLNESSLIIDKTNYDCWITQKNRGNVLYPSMISDKIYDQIASNEGCEIIDKLIYTGALIEYHNKISSIMAVGYNLSSNNIKPWDVYSGNIDILKDPLTIILDESLKRSLPNLKINETVKINSFEVKVVGFCRNAKWFVSPFGWTSLENARIICFLENFSNYINVQFSEGYSLKNLVEDIKDIEEIEAFSSSEIRANTRDYMTFESGMGMSIGIMVLMGLLVGLIIIVLTLYTSIMEKIPEFGTIKALGAGKGFIYKMLIGQVFILMTISYSIGTVLTLLFGNLVSNFTTMPVQLDFVYAFALYGITLGLGILASLISIRKVNKIDPAIVFRT